MSPQTNLAVIVSPNPLSRTLKDRGVPTPGPEEILVRVEAAGLNPVDPRIGRLYIPMWADLPTVPGAEAAGIVEAIGNDVKTFKIGDRVAFGTAGQKEDISSYQQYSLAHSAIVTKKAYPFLCDCSQACMQCVPNHPLGPGLFPPRPPEDAATLQLSRLSAFFPIITTASLKNKSYLKSLGATHVIDRSLPDAEVVKATAALAPTLFVVFDTISTQETLALGLAILRESKRYSQGKKTLLQIIPTPMPEAVSEGIDVHMGWASSAWPQNNALSRELYSQLEGFLADGTIKPMKIEVVKGGLDINVLEEAWKSFDQVSATKRVVLPQETRV
ncbi:chaperonin 10-like protein [Mycena polygramma]|nr:chaperonin 10-like protein [Mycena polygramma]